MSDADNTNQTHNSQPHTEHAQPGTTDLLELISSRVSLKDEGDEPVKKPDTTNLSKLIHATKSFLTEHNVPADHGWVHAQTVATNATLAALEDASRPWSQTEEIIAAALLHDVDDRKFFTTSDYKNARSLLAVAGYTDERVERIINMVSFVSASKFGNSCVDTQGRDIPRWQLIPRDADRVEAIGMIGIERCYEFTRGRNQPIAIATTPRPQSREELRAMNIPERFRQYVANRGNSASMVDHFFDKLLAVTQLSSGNRYLEGVAKERHETMEDWLLQWCRAHPQNDHITDLEESEKVWLASSPTR